MASGLGSSGIAQIDIPPSGLPGYVLTKLSVNDYDFDWLPAGGGGGGAPTTSQYFLGIADAFLPNGRVPFNSTTIAWDISVANQFKAEIIPGSIPIFMGGEDGLDGDIGPPGLSVPGPQGIQGNQGPPGLTIYLEPEAGSDGDAGPPGLSITGAQGIQGIPGAFLPGEDGLDGDAGPPGPSVTGPQGIQGLPGLTIYLEPEAGLDGDPGPPGKDGTSGAGSITIKEVEVDFGSTPSWDAVFTVVDAVINAASKINISESGKIATGRLVAGDSQWDSIACTALPAAGSMQVFCLALPGPVVGKRTLQYLVG